MSNTVRHALNVLSTPAPKLLAPLPSDAPAMQVIAHEFAAAQREDEIRDELARNVVAGEFDGIYKHVKVNMRGVDGNAFDIMGVAKSALKSAGAPLEHIQAFLFRCMSGDYDNLLDTVSTWLTVVDEDRDVSVTALEAFNRRKED